MWDTTELSEVIGRIVARQLMREFDPDADLLESGALDSVGVVKVLSHIEKHFAVDLPVEDLSLDDIRSVNAITEMVTRAMRCALEEEIAPLEEQARACQESQ
jgi:acyl carrier protein